MGDVNTITEDMKENEQLEILTEISSTLVAKMNELNAALI